VRFRFIEAERANYPVTALCRVLRVRRSGFYAWRKRPESERARATRALAVEVRGVFEGSRRRYGSPRVHAELQSRGERVGRHRIARLMQQQGLQARPKRRFAKTTDSKHGLAVPNNYLRRQFAVPVRNLVWVGDVTFIATVEGWLYLAVLLDLFSRRVVGWAMSDKNDEALVLAALDMAIDQRHPQPGLTHHSDRGTTYAAGGYQERLRHHQILCSMSRKGNCWDNAVAESFFSTLKTECTSRVTFATRSLARRAVFDYIATFYNSTRRHSYLGFKSPMEHERAERR
jgi:putative transposase